MFDDLLGEDIEEDGSYSEFDFFMDQNKIEENNDEDISWVKVLDNQYLT